MLFMTIERRNRASDHTGTISKAAMPKTTRALSGDPSQRSWTAYLTDRPTMDKDAFVALLGQLTAEDLAKVGLQRSTQPVTTPPQHSRQFCWQICQSSTVIRKCRQTMRQSRRTERLQPRILHRWWHHHHRRQLGQQARKENTERFTTWTFARCRRSRHKEKDSTAFSCSTRLIPFCVSILYPFW